MIHPLRHLLSLLAFVPGLALAGKGDFKITAFEYLHEGTRFEATIVTPLDAAGPLPGILMVPNWMGPTEASLDKAMKVAGDAYVVMMVDMYGVAVRPQNAAEAGAAAGLLRGDRALMRARAAKALEEFRARADRVAMDPARVAAIGFCFGGGTVLELGRAGADLDAVVSFHGDLLSPTLADDAGRTTAKVLVLHGAADPYVPQSDVEEWISVMLGTEVDWQLYQYAGAVHSFTNPAANSPGQSHYDARTAARAFASMAALFAEIWDAPSE